MNLIRAVFGSLSLNLAKWIYTTIEDPFCCTRMTDATAVQVDARCQLSSLDGRLSLKVSSFSLRNFNSLGIDSKGNQELIVYDFLEFRNIYERKNQFNMARRTLLFPNPRNSSSILVFLDDIPWGEGEDPSYERGLWQFATKESLLLNGKEARWGTLVDSSQEERWIRPIQSATAASPQA